MKLKQLLVGITALACLLAGCASMTPDEKKVASQVAGGVTGAAVGSLFGSGSGRVIMTGAGAVLGTVVGGKVAE
jgi:uncharacterized protein YcfJ